jgi:hypothetical protein
MKKFLSILVVLAAVSGAVNANVKTVDDPKVVTGFAVMKSENGFKVFYKGSKSGTVKVKITNAKGEDIYQESIKNVESFMRPYNLSSITEGDYQVEITSPEGKSIEKISYSKTKVEKLMNLVQVKNSSTKYVLMVSNKNGDEHLKVNIYDRNYKLVYHGDEEIDGDFAKVYDLASLDEKFVIEVTDSKGSTQSIAHLN